MESDYTGHPFLHPLLQLGRIRAPQIRCLRLSKMGGHCRMGRWYDTSFGHRWPGSRKCKVQNLKRKKKKMISQTLHFKVFPLLKSNKLKWEFTGLVYIQWNVDYYWNIDY